MLYAMLSGIPSTVKIQSLSDARALTGNSDSTSRIHRSTAMLLLIYSNLNNESATVLRIAIGAVPVINVEAGE